MAGDLDDNCFVIYNLLLLLFLGCEVVAGDLGDYCIVILLLFLGSEVVAGDMNDVNSLIKATRGAHGVFIVTSLSEDEMKQVHYILNFTFNGLLGRV